MFDKSFLDEEAWLRQADQFELAARIVYRKVASRRRFRTERQRWQVVGCFKSALLLWAVSVENTLKAVRVARREVVIRNGKVMKETLGGGRSGHDLLLLAREIRFDATDRERDLLSRLTTVAMWAGKYQQPLYEAQYHDTKTLAPHRIISPRDGELVRGIVRKAKKLVKAAGEAA